MLKDLVLKNRSYRGFDESRKITEDELKELVDIARVTGSGANLQPLKYKLAFNTETVGMLNHVTRWAKMLSDITLPHAGKYPTAYIAICVDTSIAKNPDAPKTDIGIVAQTILLAAVEKGLGGCMLGNFDIAEVSAILGLEATFVPALLIALGKPDETVILVDAEDGNTKYYRDENDVHYVPKRKLEDVIL